MPDQLNKWLPIVKQIAEKAGAAILTAYNASGDIEVALKEDESPVTVADKAGHDIIVAALRTLTPDIPVLSEEGELPTYGTRSAWGDYWLVDPLDGTKEFINRNGEFTVNIALIRDGRAILGVVYVPVKDIMYSAAESCGAYKESSGVITRLSVRQLPENNIAVVASRRHGAEALEAMLSRLASRFSNIDRVSMGSSLKICLVAEGVADWYPRLALTSEWDTAAAHAVLSEAGGVIVDAEHFLPLRYNQKDSLLNPYFHVFADQSVNWQALLLAE